MKSFDKISVAFNVAIMKQIFLIWAILGLAYAAPNLKQVEVNGTYTSSQSIIGSRIIGGVLANIQDLPWQVTLLHNGVHICGGVIIAPRVILTAAHCVPLNIVTPISQLNIRSASSVYNSGGMRIAVNRVIIHELYPDFLPDYDIAVLHLAADAIAPGMPAAVIPLWEAGTHFEAGTLGTISGWGTTSEGSGVGSVQLRRVDVPIVSEADCRFVYGSIISYRTLCAGFIAGGKDACQLDSGGPYVIRNRLAGIVSFGSGCGRPGTPGVYASVPGLRAWIRAHANV